MLLACQGVRLQGDSARPAPEPALAKLGVPLGEPALAFEQAPPQRDEPALVAIDPKPVQTGGVVFTGSSSIRKWTTIENDLAPLPIIARGFGGSTYHDLLRVARRLVYPHRPDILVVYEGDNDISRGHSPARVVKNARRFAAQALSELPGVEIYFLAIKPSIARWSAWPRMRRANASIEAFTKTDPRLHYIAVDEVMLQPSGAGVRREIFKRDGLHLNEAGYALWTAKIKPVLEAACRGRCD